MTPLFTEVEATPRRAAFPKSARWHFATSCQLPGQAWEDPAPCPRHEEPGEGASPWGRDGRAGFLTLHRVRVAMWGGPVWEAPPERALPASHVGWPPSREHLCFEGPRGGPGGGGVVGGTPVQLCGDRDAPVHCPAHCRVSHLCY